MNYISGEVLWEDFCLKMTMSLHGSVEIVVSTTPTFDLKDLFGILTLVVSFDSFFCKVQILL